MPSFSWNLFGRSLRVEKVPPEEELPHTFVCECDVKWVENGLGPKPCWACGKPVKANCYHI